MKHHGLRIGGKVVPHTGAWIEKPYHYTPNNVAPNMGAWIEINRSIRTNGI